MAEATKKETYTNETIEFFGANHEHKYLVNGEEVKSVTTLIQDKGITPTPDKSNEALMEKIAQAAEKGTLVHAECEKVAKDSNATSLCTEAMWWKEQLKKFVSNTIHTETLLTYLYKGKYVYCGQCDFFARRKKDKKIVLVDFKTGTSWTHESVLWQLMLYYYGLVYLGLIDKDEQVEFYCASMREDKCELVYLDPVDIGITPTEVFHFCDCIIEDKKYQRPTLELSTAEDEFVDDEFSLTVFNNLVEKFKTLPIDLQDCFFEMFDTYERQKRRDFYKACCVENGFRRGRTRNGNIYVVQSSHRVILDQKMLKEKHPKIYKECSNLREIKSFVFKGNDLLEGK